MALLWNRRLNGRDYQVRSAGSTLRLYTDGVFHSQYNPRRPVGGGVWDLLMLPAFFYPPGQVRRVLVLGVGGGAVIRLLQRFVAPECIVGVDNDPVHLELARRFFGLSGGGLALHCADAREWLQADGDEPYDLIVDDLFGGSDGEPARAFPPNAAWFDALQRRLAPAGALVMNFVSRDDLAACAYFTNRRVRGRFGSAFRLSSPREENSVGAFLRPCADSRQLRRRLAAVPELDPRPRTARLRYRIQRLDST